MALRVIAVTMLLSLFIQHIEGLQRVIVISELQDGDVGDTRAVSESNRSDIFSNLCCVYGNCSCMSLYTALVNLTSNVLINITTDVKLFGSIISLDGLDNISIVGHNNPTVHCNNYRGIHFTSCHNCIIEGITWERCGAITDNKNDYPVLQFYNSSSVNIKKCSFQNSTGQALVLSALSGDVHINYCNFLYNIQYRGHGAAIYYSPNNLYQSGLNVIITNCKFFYNEATSVVYLGPPSAKTLQKTYFHLQNSIFYLNKAIPIYLSNQKLYIYGNIEFYGNMAENGGGIFISNYSQVTFHNNDRVTFKCNTAIKNGGAIYLTDHSSVFFEQNSTSYHRNNPLSNETSTGVFLFYRNRANNFGKNIYAYQSYVTFGNKATALFNGGKEHGESSAVHIEHYSKVTFEGDSEGTFTNYEYNYGAALYIHDQSEVTFRGNTKVKFYDNVGNHESGAMYVHYSTATFTENCNVVFDNNLNEGALYIRNSFVRFQETSLVMFNNNKAFNGGAMYIANSSTVKFEGNSNVEFDNNEASNNGAAMFTEDYSIVIFEVNSMAKFHNNKAENDGGAMYVADYSILTFKGNSKATFTNDAADDGGGMYADNSTVKFEENSTVTFKNNEAYYNGGAMYVTDYSTVTTEGDSTINLISNKAYTDGGALYISYAAVTFAGDSKVSFNNNSANSGGAVYSFLTCIDIIQILWFAGNSTISFDNNKGDDKGGAVSIDGTDPTYTENCYPLKFDDFSKVIFTNNEGFNGGAIYVGYNINIKSQEKSTLEFRNNLAHIGGAIYSYVSNITFQGNSSATFNNNAALQDGGVLFSYRHCNISFTENSSMTCAHNEAAQGGVIHIHFSSVIKFQGNCKITFTENKAIEYGGVIHSSVNSLVVFDDYANVLFHSNMAKSGGAVNLFKSSITSRLKSNVIFKSNSAQMGGAIYISQSNITFAEYCSLQFIKNTALQDGGAIYLSDHSIFTLTNNTKVNFSDNFADDYGKAIYLQIKQGLLIFNITKFHFSCNNLETTRNLIYINVPKSCNRSCLFQRVIKFPENISLPIFTSPRRLIIYDPAICSNRNKSDCNTYYISNIMLGQEIKFNACVLDYYNQPTELTQFLVTGMNHQHYNMSGSKYISVSCNHTTQGISIIGNLNTLSNYSIDISMYAAKTSGSKNISVKLIVELSQCHLGFQYSSQKCECYDTKNIISCSGSNSTIKRGYWFGSVNGKQTITTCPNDYCNFTCCEINNGIYHLSPVRTNQCKPHRSGAACGNCEKGYTLSFDSPECIEVNKCTIGQTVLVTALSFLYWITVIVTVFIMMHFKVSIASLYAIIYYYSVADIFLRQASFSSNGLYTAINILSSLAKLTPQFLGQLCLAINMSGIDQQFIHYVHPIVVLLILVLISMLARRSRKISLFISRGIIHFICFLLLLSYTSVTTTSLLLMRSLKFIGINEVYTYLSPDVEYFHGRHLAYVIVAMMFTILFVISLPLILLLEPFLNSKINFVKIKPFLDQFQGGYKDKYRYFAAYYLICRIVIIVLVIVRSSDDLITHYMLITACALMALIHLIVRPYADKIYNMFDGIILQLIVIMSVLPIIDFVENYDEILVAVVAYLCIISPLVAYITMILWINKNRIQDVIKSLIIKHLHKYNTIPTDDMEIPAVSEAGITLDNRVRRNTTVVSM